MSAIDLLKSILKEGIHPEQTFREKKEIIFVNKVALSLSLIGLFITLIEILFGYFTQAAFALSIFLFVPTAILAQKHRRHDLAKFMIFIIPSIATISCIYLYGTNGNSHYYLISLLAIGLIFFKPKRVKALLFIYHAGLFTYMESASDIYIPPILVPESDIHNLANVVAMLFTIWLLLFEFQNHERQYETKLNHLMGSLREQSELLKLQKIQIEKQADDLKRTNIILKREAIEKEEAQKKLLASNKDLKQYASIVSHDLKEPLRTVGSFTQLIHKRHQNEFDKTSKEYVNFVVDAVGRMSRLLDDLLTFSRLNHQLDFEESDLNNIMELVKHDLRHQFREENGILISDPLPLACVNRQQFAQLFQNLISNGLKFRRKNVAPIIKIEYNETSENHVFFVHDNGIGIPIEYQEKIFTLFQRLHARGEYEGSGVGLSICRKVVHNHGGKIWLEPSHEPGATIGFSIPKNKGCAKKITKKKTLEAVEK